MLKRLLLLPIAAILCLTASAQFNYTLKDTNTAYVPLAGGSLLNGGNLWFGDNFVAPMPFSWKLDNSITLSSLPLMTQFPLASSDTSNFNDVNGFMFADLGGFVDRGVLGISSQSPIRYVTTGTAPSRIFKLEFVNAGFAQELFIYSTLDDSVNVQIWIYETSNIVELHYGTSRITNPADYFVSGTSAPLIGYLKHVDFLGGTSGTVHYIKGNASGTAMDSISITASAPPANALSAWPASGKVFRFTPNGNPCVKPTPNYTSGSPVGKTVQYTYTGTTAGLDSLVWNFGDATRQKITAGFTTPVTHTFANNGHYNVCVTAYNSCGSNVSCSQLALAVGGLAGLGNVTVSPNPAASVITIEGMKPGGKVMVVSVTGQQMMTADISSTRQILDLSALPAGVYNLVLFGNDGARGATQITKL